ncbi:phosphotransferase [Venatoribacter cucullus]|uniref:Phosphotransferase n=1 Tax=Venatoribacter cucullus TaxID=2661630 RepID=A0A9X7V3F0_9GAMM|nr:phosphotransferase [Venatoribacter cucullus]QQD24919.1 phosphotransferase [Venatoribacter cucullus]
MDQRREDLAQWAVAMIRQHADFDVTAKMDMVSGDASFRRYFRLHCLNHSWIAVDAPADKEDNPRFVAVAKAWRDQDVTVPKVIAHDFERGFMLLEDFGDQLLWPALHADGLSEKDLADLYGQAITQLLHIQQLPTDNLPPYDAGLLDREMALFRDWLCQQLLGMELSDAEQELLHQTFTLLRASALAQPVVAVHRDYHSRNLMLRPDGSLGVIDFQDAVAGPATYDLVSLLRDCYVRWPATLVDELAALYWEQARPQGIYLGDWAQFRRDFDWMGLQRHLKAAGIFARLHLRDGKSGYLADIPNTCQYLLDISARYDELAAFHAWLQQRFMPLLAQLPASETPHIRDSSAE